MTPETGLQRPAVAHLLHPGSLLHRRSEAVLGAEHCPEHVHRIEASAPPPRDGVRHRQTPGFGPPNDSSNLSDTNTAATTTTTEPRETGMDEHTRQTLVAPSITPVDGDAFALLRRQLAELERPVSAAEPVNAALATTKTKWGKFVAWLYVLVGLGDSNPNDPMRLLAALAVAAVTGVISYQTLADLGSGLGFGEPGSHLFPIGIDAAVFLFTRTWMNRNLSKETRKFGKSTALFFMIMSVAGNAIEHGKRTYDAWTAARLAALAAHRGWQPGTMGVAWLVVTLVFSALMPLALGLSLHVISRVADDARASRNDQAETPHAAAKGRRRHRGRQEPRKARTEVKPKPQQAESTTPAPSDGRKPEPKPTSIEHSSERPAWVTGDMSPTAAMNRYLDEHGETAGAVLEKWATNLGLAQEFKPGLGRTTLLRWKAKRADKPAAAAGGE